MGPQAKAPLLSVERVVRTGNGRGGGEDGGGGGGDLLQHIFNLQHFFDFTF